VTTYCLGPPPTHPPHPRKWKLTSNKKMEEDLKKWKKTSKKKMEDDLKKYGR
jgi:hypothetical protein